jgi:hypothetical protein
LPPFGGITEAQRWVRVALGAVVILVLGALMERRWPVSPGNIVQFELAGDADAPTYLRSWGVDEKRRAAQVVVLDFPFLVAYGVGGALLLDGVARWSASRNEARSRLLRRAAWLAIAAAAFDVLENLALLVVTANQARGWPNLAKGFALTKFALLAVWALALVGAVVLAVAARSQRRHPPAVEGPDESEVALAAP